MNIKQKSLLVGAVLWTIGYVVFVALMYDPDDRIMYIAFPLYAYFGASVFFLLLGFALHETYKYFGDNDEN